MQFCGASVERRLLSQNIIRVEEFIDLRIPCSTPIRGAVTFILYMSQIKQETKQVRWRVEWRRHGRVLIQLPKKFNQCLKVAQSDVGSPLDATRLALQVEQKQTGSLQVLLLRLQRQQPRSAT